MALSSQGNFSPLPLWSRPVESLFTPDERIQQLEALLKQESYKRQTVNIIALIDLYRTGKLKPSFTRTLLWDGKIVDRIPEKLEDKPIWLECIGTQFMQSPREVTDNNIPCCCEKRPSDLKLARGSPTGTNRASYGLFPGMTSHEIFARFRLISALGGDANRTVDVTIGNDTGSSFQTIFVTDLQMLNYNPHTYQGNAGQIRLTTVSSKLLRDLVLIEIQLLRADGTVASPWIQEFAVVTPEDPNIPLPRLSGNAMRNHLYFATAPGDAVLYTAEKKNGLISQLPVV